MSLIEKIPDCKRFTGYKPCFPGHDCLTEGCKDQVPFGTKILIINLDAMGDVLMTTAQLQTLKKKFPVSTIYWVTLPIAAPLLFNNPLVDKVFPYNFESLTILQSLEFDYVMNVDKSQRSGSLAMQVNAQKRMGFGINSNGQIIPLNEGANYNYKLGMDDHLKFRVNTTTGQEYLSETFEIPYERNDYVFQFTDEELKFIEDYKKEVGITPENKIIGFNTGCSNLYPNKKMTVAQHIYLIERFLSYGEFKIMLLGGPEDEMRNKEIYSHFEGKIISTPTNNGIRKGACYESIPQVIITGDSFGMHLAIALKKYIIAWFGLSCWQEIDLYDRGIKLFPKDLECAPCWKKSCPYDLECIKQIDLKQIENAAVNFFESVNVVK